MRVRGAFCCGLFAASLYAASVSADALRYDPFVRPAEKGASDSFAASDEAWRPILRSTLLAGDASMVNLGGRLLRVGEEAGGYRLVEVGRFEATFERGGERLTLPVAKETTR